MDKSIVPGQTMYILFWDPYRTGYKKQIHKCTVKTVGHKYITVKDAQLSHRFYIDDFKHELYSDMRLFVTVQDILDFLTRRRFMDTLYEMFSGLGRDEITLDQVLRVMDILRETIPDIYKDDNDDI